MKHVKVLGAALVLMAASACATAPGPAHAQPAHPAYLHALSDLRMARALLDRPAEYNVVRDQFAAIDHVNGAIGEIRHASYDDGKDPNWNPPIDTNINHRGRLSKALDLIATAERDLPVRGRQSLRRGLAQCRLPSSGRGAARGGARHHGQADRRGPLLMMRRAGGGFRRPLRPGTSPRS
ncbi:hypothetical protein [Nitrospirillum sp. BR 11163]|uniref:hypothetical protein n=1 Tax=Nitrospirillum sp. BR 11163 TaxID=3104323 RepID=UPI002AFEA67B|nr:hypothetical protein [Nitrospirillum sp. BR 11163]MEA1674869.1 hypothetical protein [Nitrospirillum sp. BR 11163]